MLLCESDTWTLLCPGPRLGAWVELVVANLTGVEVDQAKARLPGRLLLVARASAGGQRVDVEREGVLAALGVGFGDVLVVARPARPALVLVVAVGSQPVAHPVGERGQAVAVPLLERVAGLGQPGTPALVGQGRDLVDQVRVQWPAVRDEGGDVPRVVVV